MKQNSKSHLLSLETVVNRLEDFNCLQIPFFGDILSLIGRALWLTLITRAIACYTKALQHSPPEIAAASLI